MFGPPAHLYVYFTYGMHWCANAVCRDEGDAAAVLLRAIAPIDGIDLMRIARKNVKRDRDLGSGPAKLCQALGIGPVHNGVDLTRASSPVRIVDDGTPPPESPVVAPRVGLSVGVDQPWRWYVPADVNVSRR
jgi:DNA-3-methyladenine glycosylase